MQRRYVFLGMAALLLAAGVWTWNLTRPVEAPATVDIGGAFTLVDQNGRTVRDTDYRGSYLLIFFGYTYCPDVCPTALQAVTETMNLLGKDAAKVQPLFVTVDPERDTPEVLKSYIENFHPRLIGLTGSPAQVAAAAKAYRVYFAKVVEDGAAEDEYLMNHSSIIYLMGPDGKFIAHFSHITTPEDMAAGIRKYI